MIKAKYLTKVTDLTKVLLQDAISEGDVVIDATMGNGNDTKYLAEKVCESGFVYSFDVQEIAIKNTTKLINKNNLQDRVKLILDGHQNISKYVSEPISCALFNLGYLPRADHSVITKPDTTIEAIKQCLDLLKPHGIVSLAVYTGHEGGELEGSAVLEFVSNLDQTYFNVLKSSFINQKNNPPHIIMIEKKKEY